MRTIAIISKTGRPAARKILNRLVEYLVRKDCSVRSCEEWERRDPKVEIVKEHEILDGADLFVVLGGDGTLIHAVHLLDGRDIPVLGVNLGTLGFLTEIPENDMIDVLEQVLKGDYQSSDRMMLRVSLMRGDHEVLNRAALNDVVINKGALARIIRLETSTEGGMMTQYRGDGLIISTPTGSTAYNMAAGGPVLYPTLDAFILTPICPHTFANRPVVLPSGERVEVELVEANGEVYVSIDGQEAVQMLEGDRLMVRRAVISVRLIRSPRHDYFQILRHKLGWGQD